MSHWQVGDVSITKVTEQQIAMPAEHLLASHDPARLDMHAAWLKPDFMQADGQLLISIHSLIVRSKGKIISVDTCMGNDRPLPFGFPPLSTSFLKDFEKVVPRKQVDYVLCTHLHFDHIGWNTMKDGESWVPTFPNARYLFGRSEFEYWISGATDDYIDFRYAIDPIIDAGLHELVDPWHRITDEVSLMPTPGHTPGHVSVVIRSQGEQAVITGDMLHHPVQLAEPTWPTGADTNKQVSTATRLKYTAEWLDQPILIIGTHFAGPSAGRLVSADNHHRMVPDAG